MMVSRSDLLVFPGVLGGVFRYEVIDWALKETFLALLKKLYYLWYMMECFRILVYSLHPQIFYPCKAEKFGKVVFCGNSELSSPHCMSWHRK